MTETDLITAGGSGENVELPQSQTVNSDISSSATPERTRQTARPPRTTPTAEVAAGDRPAALSTMVLPELRALANEIGVEGASGMRKSELIAAIRERRGERQRLFRPQASAGTATRLPPLSLPADTATEAGTTEQHRRGADPASSAASVAAPPARPAQPAARTRTSRRPTSRTRPTPKASRTAKQDTKSDGDDQQGEQGRPEPRRQSQAMTTARAVGSPWPPVP